MLAKLDPLCGREVVPCAAVEAEDEMSCEALAESPSLSFAAAASLALLSASSSLR